MNEILEDPDVGTERTENTSGKKIYWYIMQEEVLPTYPGSIHSRWTILEEKGDIFHLPMKEIDDALTRTRTHPKQQQQKSVTYGYCPCPREDCIRTCSAVQSTTTTMEYVPYSLIQGIE
mmetsp:Transcript_27655/g.31087  ORF Transcript_27655/g.31087 Transcript_27655/m.31087 type:complete len:119 (+) Transcript_27655:874-1230(+)